MGSALTSNGLGNLRARLRCRPHASFHAFCHSWILVAMLASMQHAIGQESAEPPKWQKATFAGGCFWCTEAVYQEIRGVDSVVSGYTGGTVANPTYGQVSSGSTGHAEAIELTYDPETVSYEKLVEIHLHTHDPTQLNRQGPDVGTQYRSGIFYHSKEQQEIAERVIAKLQDSKEYKRPIVTQLAPAETFYVAEKYHQDFYQRNPRHGYCSAVVRDKVRKVRKLYADYLK